MLPDVPALLPVEEQSKCRPEYARKLFIPRRLWTGWGQEPSRCVGRYLRYVVDTSGGQTRSVRRRRRRSSVWRASSGVSFCTLTPPGPIISR